MPSKLEKLSFVVTLATFAIVVGSLVIYPWWSKYRGEKKTKCPVLFFEGAGDLPGDCYYSTCNDISSDGSKVVGSSFSNVDDAVVKNDGGCCATDEYTWDGARQDGHCNEAFGWTRPCRHLQFFNPPWVGTGGITGLGYGHPAKNAANAESFAYGISPDGKRVVGYTNFDKNNNCVAVKFLPGSNVITLGHWDSSTVARDISQNNMVVGYSTTAREEPLKAAGAQAVYWDLSNNINLLSMPASWPVSYPIVSSEAVCISDDGKYIGGNIYYDTLYSIPDHFYMSIPCVWKYDPQTGTYGFMQLLENFTGGAYNANLSHISGNGNVIVGWGNKFGGSSNCSGASYQYIACMWKLGGSIWSAPDKLSNLTGYMTSVALGVSKDGSVIVGVSQSISCDFSTLMIAPVIWNASTPASIPTSIASALGSKIPASWELLSASRVVVNSTGQKIIIGYGFNPAGSVEGWVAGL